jgi:Flp pilus assembly protein TadG
VTPSAAGPSRFARTPSSDRGAVAVEVAVVTPALLGLLMLVMLAGRTIDAATDVQTAATAAARAASLRSSPEAATRAAHDTADIADAGIACRSFDLDVATERLHPGGSVSVTVRCEVDYSDIALVAAPGVRTFTADATAVVDTYLGEGPP